MITDDVTMNGKDYLVTWLPPPFEPPRELTSQCGGVCFTEGGQVAVVTMGDEKWGLPAGHPESGEGLPEALVREVAEEACARVLAYEYIGCHKVVGPVHDAGGEHPINYSAKFWARIKLLPFEQRYETTARKLVLPDEVLTTVDWETVASAQAMVRAAKTEEEKRTRRMESSV